MAPSALPPPVAPLSLPRDYVPWWQVAAMRPLRSDATPRLTDVDSLVVETLRYSQRVKALSERPLIVRTTIVEAQAEFDVRAFVDSRLTRTSVPVGDELTTGGPPRLRDLDTYSSGGLRKKTRWGGRLELSQKFGFEDSNSLFFTPAQQGNARLSLSFTQPLLNGAGPAYNDSLTVLAQIDTRLAWASTAKDLQNHLLQVAQVHWELYLNRVVLLQKKRLLAMAESVLNRLEARRGIDSLESQLSRARAAVAIRRAELIRAASSIRDAEATLRALTNSPELLANDNLELVPREPPLRDYVPVDLPDALVTAMKSRPEIDEVLQRVQSASVRLGVAKNELLPVLDLVLESYVSGLQGDYDANRAWEQQWNEGEPSYTVGMKFEMPLCNRAAQARFERRQLELRQLRHELAATSETLRSDVEIAVREVQTSYQQMVARYRAMVAAQANLDYLDHRWESLPGDDRSASFLLEDLLDAQDRLALEEFGFAQAQVAYTTSFYELKRAMGTLLTCQGIAPCRAQEDCLPRILFENQPGEPVPENVSP
jgi:outer membrane protein TolC